MLWLIKKLWGNESWRKVLKLSGVFSVVLICNIYLYVENGKDHDFLITGGIIGCASSVCELGSFDVLCFIK
jgi:hypothetical protein